LRKGVAEISGSAPAPLRHVSIGAGRPIVLLHPIAMRVEFWDAVAERLSRSFRVVSLDLRGHGKNARADEPFSIDDLAGDVIALAKELSVGHATFVGCSMGGMVAQGVALRAPELVSGLVLANTTHTMGDKGAEVMRKRAEDSLKGLDHTIEQDINRWFSERFRAEHPDTVAKVRGWVLENDARTVSFGWQAISCLNYEDRLGGVSQPVLVTTGALDPASPPSSAQRTAAAFPNGRFVEIAACGHFSPIERPDAFADLVAEFVEPALATDH
jgi:3-oxoadipate enol-lactonase